MHKLDSKNFNLSDSELKLYIVLLNEGPKTVLELSKSLSVSRTGIYKIIEKLIEGGLVKKKKNAYHPLSPELLYDRLMKEEENIKKQKVAVETLIEMSKKPTVKVFFGDEGLGQLISELRKKPVDKGYLILNSDYLPEKFKSRRSREAFPEDVVINFTNKKKKKGRKNEIHIPYKKQDKFSSVSIFDDQIAFNSESGDNYTGLLIVDKNLANLLKDLIDNISK